MPWKATIGEAIERKRLKYSDLAAEAVTGLANLVASNRGWLQRFSSHSNNQATEGGGNQRTGLLTSR